LSGLFLFSKIDIYYWKKIQAMKKVPLFEEFLNENLNSAFKLLDEIFKEAKKSKNFSEVKMMTPDYEEDWIGDVIYIKSKLKGESSYHKNDLDEFVIGIDPDTKEVSLHYMPSGNDSEVNSLEEFIQMSRAK
jgi:hypothetical protein